MAEVAKWHIPADINSGHLIDSLAHQTYNDLEAHGKF